METELDIPPTVTSPANAAVDWINNTEQSNYELTGVVDYDSAFSAQPGEPYELGLILCDGELCRREQVRVIERDGEFEFNRAEMRQAAIPPLLDPPVGLRKAWLDEQLEKFDFILLLFYRGRW